MGGTLRVGIVGVGKISEQYFASFPHLPQLQLVAVADLDEARAAAVAAEHGVRSLAVDELVADPGIDVVLNLTIPAAHVDVAIRAIRAGKHVYGEKPLGLSVEEARPMLELADAAGVRVGSAPDTVLGTGIQTSRQLLDAGVIGSPVGASAVWVSPGHEAWHPAPQFYYQAGGGPLLDMGPYYITALVELLGPIVRVSGTVGRSDRERVVGTGSNAGSPVSVEVDTHINGLLEHRSGATSSILMSFDVWKSQRTPIEVYGTAGTIAVPDPNLFSAPVSVWTTATGDWSEVEPTAGFVDAGRGYGLADLADAIADGRPHRASGELALHVLDVMESIILAGTEHRTIELTTTVEPSAPVPLTAS